MRLGEGMAERLWLGCPSLILQSLRLAKGTPSQRTILGCLDERSSSSSDLHRIAKSIS